MNSSLPIEITWSLAVTFLIGLWLIWQSIVIAYQVNILSIILKWISQRFILVPSVLFITIPFIWPYLIRQMTTPSINVVAASIDRALTILVTASGIFIGNRYLEGFRKKQEQQKVVRLIIFSVENQLGQLQKILRDFKAIPSKSDIEILKVRIHQVQHDSTYESVMKQIGIFDIQEIHCVSEHNKELSYISALLFKVYDEDGKLLTTNNVMKEYVKRCIRAFEINSRIFMIKLNNKFLKDDEQFKAYKECLKRNYCLEMAISQKKGYPSDEIKPVLEKTEQFFKELGAITELETACKTWGL